jgi:hypothetical protein
MSIPLNFKVLIAAGISQIKLSCVLGQFNYACGENLSTNSCRQVGLADLHLFIKRNPRMNSFG